MQPIVVRPLPNRAGGETQYEIVAGERRWRAAQIAGLRTIPAVIRDIPDEAAVAVALIENIQREDLNPIEEARSLHRLIEEFGLTHADCGRRRRPLARHGHATCLRLLELPRPVRELLEHRQLDMGHARALLGLGGSLRQQIELADAVVKKGLERARDRSPVRQLRRGTRAPASPPPAAPRARPERPPPRDDSPKRSAPPSRSSTAPKGGGSS